MLKSRVRGGRKHPQIDVFHSDTRTHMSYDPYSCGNCSEEENLHFGVNRACCITGVVLLGVL